MVIRQNLAEKANAARDKIGKHFDLINKLYGIILEIEEDSDIAKETFIKALKKWFYKDVKIIKWDYENTIAEFHVGIGGKFITVSFVRTTAKKLDGDNYEISTELIKT